MNMPDEDAPLYQVTLDRLEGQWAEQTGLSRRTGRAEAEARHRLSQAKTDLDAATADARYESDRAKARLAEAEAAAELEVRKSPEKFGLGIKPTIPEVTAAVAVQPAVKAARDAYIGHTRISDAVKAATREVNDCRRLLDFCEADTRAVVDRRKTLENLVELMGLDYFNDREPRAPDAQTRQKIAERTSRRVRQGIDPDED